MGSQDSVQYPARMVRRPVDKSNDASELYLDLLKRCLTRTLHFDPYQRIDPMRGTWKRRLYLLHLPLRKSLARFSVEIVRVARPGGRIDGRDFPAQAETMIGLKRLDNLHSCIRDVLEQGVPGDLLEAGVWRGGASIFMRAALEAYGDDERLVWAADSFQGLPAPDSENYPSDDKDTFYQNPHLAVSLDEVRTNFRRYGLLDERVQFLPGWFRETLSRAPVERIAVLRLDGDMYESTFVALEALYDKVTVGGYVIVDDYFAVPKGAGRATDDFRHQRDIQEELVRIDWGGAYWKRLR